MNLDNDTVHQIARLARLHASEADIDRYREELSRILSLVEQMDACETDGVEPMTHPFDNALRLRHDEVTEQDNRSKFQQIAPSVDRGLYLVPRVID